MKKNKTIPKNNVLKLIRRIRNLTLKNLEDKSKVGVTLVSSYENDKIMPTRETIIRLASALDVGPDIILCAYGYLPDREMNIMREDPYYYMDKIQKMCKNHSSRYSEDNANIDDLNIARTYDYIIKSMEEKKKEGNTNT